MGLFSRKTPKQKLEKEYRKLLAESHRLSTVNRTESDKMAAKADEVLRKMDSMEG